MLERRAAALMAGRRIFLVLAAILAVGGAAYLLSGRPGSASSTRSIQPVASGTPEPVQFAARGTVVPIRHADLTTSTAGLITEVAVAEGATVTAGQLLLRLESGDELAGVQAAQAAVARADAQVTVAQARRAALPADATSGQRAVATAEIAVANAERTAAGVELQAAQVALAATELHAPFAGTVVTVQANVGELADPGKAVIQLGDLSSWVIETADIQEGAAVRIQTGDSAVLRFDALPDLELPGTVSFVALAPVVTTLQTAYTVRVVPTGSDPRLRWGMSASVTITPGT